MTGNAVFTFDIIIRREKQRERKQTIMGYMQCITMNNGMARIYKTVYMLYTICIGCGVGMPNAGFFCRVRVTGTGASL